MSYDEFLQWLQAHLSTEREKYAPAGAAFGLPVFKNPVSGETYNTIADAAKALKTGGKLSVGYADAREPVAILDKDVIDARLRMIGIFEGDRRFEGTGDVHFKKAYQGIKQFTADEKGKMLFCPEYDRLHEKVLKLEADKKLREQLSEQFPHDPLPPFFVRTYRAYLDVSGTEEAARNNYRLQESMKTETGRRAFITRVLKDVMAVDYTEMFKARSIEQRIDYYAENRTLFEVLHVFPNLVELMSKEEYAMDKSVCNVLKNFDLLAQSGGMHRSYTDMLQRDGYFMLPALDFVTGAMMVSEKNPPVIQREATFVTGFFGAEDMFSGDAASINQLAELGGLSPFVKLQDENKEPLKLQKAVDLITKGKKVTVIPLSEEEKRHLEQQLDNPYGLTEEQLNEIDGAAERFWNYDKNYDKNLSHQQELSEAGIVGALRKELEFNQVMLGQSDRTENGEVYEKHMAKILVLANLIGKVEKLQEEYKNSPAEELSSILETVTDPEQINTNVQIIRESAAFRAFLEQNTPEELETLSMKQNDIGVLTDNRYEKIREISGLFEKQFSLKNAEAYAVAEAERQASKAAELEAAKKWYLSLGEKLQEQGIDIQSRYAMGLICNAEVPEVLPDDVDTQNMDCDEICDIIASMGEGSGYAFMARNSSGEYAVPAPADKVGRLRWLADNLQSYAEADDRMILYLYRQAKNNTLVLRPAVVGNDWANPPKLIKADRDGNALITPEITEFLSAANADAPANERYRDYGYTDEDMKQIERMAGALVGLQMGKEELLTDARRKGLDETKLRRLNEDIYYPNAEKALIRTATRHPDWVNTPEKSEKLFRVYQARAIPLHIRTAEEARLAEVAEVPSEAAFEIEADLLKTTGAESLAELMTSGAVTRADKTAFTTDDSLKFLLEVTNEVCSNAILLTLPDKNTGELTTLPYIKHLDFGILKAGNAEEYAKALSETTLTPPIEDSDAYNKLTEAIHSAQESLSTYSAQGTSYGLLDSIADTVTALKPAAEEYCRALSEKAELTAADIGNLKSLAQLTLLTDAAEKKDPFAKKDMVRAVALKLVCEQGTRLLATEGLVTIPAHGDAPAQQVHAKELGRQMLTDAGVREQFVAVRLAHPAFAAAFGRMDDVTLKQIMKTEDRRLLNTYIEAAKSFEKKQPVAQEQKKELAPEVPGIIG